MMYGLLSVGILGLLAVLLFGWIVPLVIGIVRRHSKRGGGVLLIIGGVWGVIGISLMVLMAVAIVNLVRTAQSDHAEEFSAATYPGPTGWAGVSWPGEFKITLAGTGERSVPLRVQGSNGAAVAPAGTSTLTAVEFTESAANGEWSASARFRKGRSVTIEAGATNPIPAALPLIASIEPEPVCGTNVVFNFRLVDNQGDSWQIRESGPGARAPGFEVRGPDDVVLWRGDFQYG